MLDKYTTNFQKKKREGISKRQERRFLHKITRERERVASKEFQKTIRRTKYVPRNRRLSLSLCESNIWNLYICTKQRHWKCYSLCKSA